MKKAMRLHPWFTKICATIVKARSIIVPILLLVLLAGLCSACSRDPAESEPVTEAPSAQETPAASTEALPETTPAATATESTEAVPAEIMPETPPESETTEMQPAETQPVPSDTPTVVIIPAPDMGDKPRLSEFSDEDLINYMLAYGVVWGADPGPAGSAGYTKLAEETRNNILEIEADPYGFYARAVSYTEIAFVSEKIRCAVCDYYEWPQIRLTLKSADGDGAVLTDFQLWSLPEKTFHGRVVTATETGVKMTFISPSPKPQSGDFRRKMTIYQEPAEIIRRREQAEDPKQIVNPEDFAFPDGSAVIYSHGNDFYTAYLYIENGLAAVKIDVSLTKEELMELLWDCRLLETVVSAADTAYPLAGDASASSAVYSVLSIPAADLGTISRLSELPAGELIDYLADHGYDFADIGGKPDPEKDTEAVAGIIAWVREAEEAPYGFIGRSTVVLSNDKLRTIVCAYYDWPLIRVVLAAADGSGRRVTEFQEWYQPEGFLRRQIVTSDSGIQIIYAGPSEKPSMFERTVTIWLELAEVITQKEMEEDPAAVLKDSAGYGSFSGASAVIYDHGDNAYTIYLRLEDGPAAVKIEASLTLEEVAALLSSIRLFDVTAGTDSIVREQGKILPELKEACEDFINQTAGFPMAGPTEILYDQAYPVTFTEGFLTARYKEESSLLALAGENHQWRIPVFFEDGKSGEIRLTQNENGSWAVAGWLKNEEKEPQIAASMDAIRAAIDQNPQLAKAETVRILADTLYNAVFVVAVSGGQEYVVPFGIRLEEAKIETGTMYTADDLIGLLERCFDESGRDSKPF